MSKSSGATRRNTRSSAKTEIVNITRSWHKANSPIAMTYNQYDYIRSLDNGSGNLEMPFSSANNAMRSLTKSDASEIIDALKAGKKVVIE